MGAKEAIFIMGHSLLKGKKTYKQQQKLIQGRNSLYLRSYSLGPNLRVRLRGLRYPTPREVRRERLIPKDGSFRARLHKMH